MHVKRFSEWIDLKEKLDSKKVRVPYVSEGQIWWASLGQNVGFEINGKSQDFTRPILIFRKLAHGFYFVIPLTTQNKQGSWYVNFKHQEREVTACLQQARAIDYRRLTSRMAWLDETDFSKIKVAFQKLYL